MTNITRPPVNTEIIDNNGKPPLVWAQWFENFFTGDNGSTWVPTLQNLTEVGTATKSGIYYRLSQNLYYVAITITPTTSISATAGTTYVDNFPLRIRRDGANLAVANNVGSSAGMNVAANNRIYIPALSAVTTPVTIVTLMEAS